MKFYQLTETQQKAVKRKIPKKHLEKFIYSQSGKNSLNADLKFFYKIISKSSVVVLFPFHILREFWKVLKEEVKYSSFKTSIENIYYEPTEIIKMSKEEFF